jgi:hypothetical protein
MYCDAVSVVGIAHHILGHRPALLAQLIRRRASLLETLETLDEVLKLSTRRSPTISESTTQTSSTFSYGISESSIMSSRRSDSEEG